ncbi:MAG TPA: amylo-alpha-1,6-glucosidase [Chloroflexia bacterium]|nr:amylo-alpha-1,6-glucosidase [Chloroflexia bacterium]
MTQQIEKLASNKLPYTRLERPLVNDVEHSLETEWQVTNGIGGFAAASLSGALTRRYHGLLLAALQPPLGRTLLLSKLDEIVRLNNRDYPLDVNEWRDASMALSGLDYLESFEQFGNLPTFTYRIAETAIQKTIWMEYGQNTTYVRYKYAASQSSTPVKLLVKPLANCRDYHAETKGSINQHYAIEQEKSSIASWKVEPWPEAPSWRLLVMDHPAQFRANEGSGWYWGFHYRQEKERGLIADEDLYCLGTFVVTLEPGQSVTFVASTAELAEITALYPEAYERELARQEQLLDTAKLYRSADPLENLAARLALAADQFVVGRPDPARTGALLADYRTVIAGYPWFSDWGRDTMIALPGLTIVTGRYSEAALLLRSFARYVSKGMLPNRFPDPVEISQSSSGLSESDYNTVDATLWYFDAVDKYLTASGDSELGQELYPVLADIVNWHLKGTRFQIHVDKDGLLFSGEPGVQLTWMDVKIGEWVVTPRRGKPIEINALWHRACKVMAKLASRYGSAAEVEFYTGLAGRVAAIFEETYWYARGGYFYDNINDAGEPDSALRPNQAIALSVAPELVSAAKRRAALEKVQEKLYTPVGLRTLSADHPDYHPVFGGDPISRDSAYHQGTVWPWPLGPYARALLTLEDQDREQNRIQLQHLLMPFLRHIDEGCVGQINEVFSAEPPYRPGGCVAQAWSVSELLEIWQLYQNFSQ